LSEMTGNPLSGHTNHNMPALSGDATAVDGLADGDHIVSASLTNFLEGIHGNGIILEEDTAGGATNRNVPEDLPGVCEQVTNDFTIRITGGHAIIDGVCYAFAGGPGSSQDITLNTSSASYRAGTALTSGQEALIVVYVTSDGSAGVHNIYFEMGTAITTAANAYPSSPTSFLNQPNSSLNVKQSVVLAVLRVVHTTAGGATNDLNIEVEESNDKRVFVRPTPLYLTPVVDGAVGATDSVNSHTDLDAIRGGGSEDGDFAASRLGAIWQSYNANNEAMLYYSRKDASNRHTHLLGPTNVLVSSPSTNQTFTFDSDQIFVLTPSTTINLNPSGTFPPGHAVFVSVPSGSTVTFDSTGLNSGVVATEASMFVYDGSNWKKVMVSGTVSPASSGVSGLVQLSDGAGGFTSDTTLSYNTGSNELTVDGKLTVTGLIDPTGLVIDEKANVAATGHTTAAAKGLIWVKNDSPNRLYFTDDAGTDKKVIHATDSVTELSDVTAVGSGSIISSAERTKLNAIEASADVTDETNVKAALSGATITSATVATDDKVLVQDTNDSDNLKTVTAQSIADLAPQGDITNVGVTAPITGGGSSGDVTIAISAATTSAAGSMSSADKTKLDAIEASADVTDATNVAAAGAIMDSDFSSNGLMKRTGAGSYDSVTVTSAGEALLDDTDADAQRDTLGIIAQKVGADQSNDLATGWWTIAYIEGRDSSGASEQRGYADFLVRDNQVSRHQAVRFAAGHHFGSDVSATLNLFNNTAYSTSEPIIGLRIKEAGIYAGAALQIEIGQSTNSLRCFAHFNEQNDGWKLLDTWLQDSDNSGHDAILGYSTDSWTNFTAKSYIDLQHDALDASKKGGIATVGGLTVSANKGGSTFNPVFQVENTETVVNDTGYSDHDFRVESDTNTHMLFVDASADKVGVGKTGPTKTLDVAGTITTSGRLNQNTAFDGSTESGIGDLVHLQLKSGQGNMAASGTWQETTTKFTQVDRVGTSIASYTDGDGEITITDEGVYFFTARAHFNNTGTLSEIATRSGDFSYPWIKFTRTPSGGSAEDLFQNFFAQAIMKVSIQTSGVIYCEAGDTIESYIHLRTNVNGTYTTGTFELRDDTASTLQRTEIIITRIG
jgi:hypothetical protein